MKDWSFKEKATYFYNALKYGDYYFKWWTWSFKLGFSQMQYDGFHNTLNFGIFAVTVSF